MGNLFAKRPTLPPLPPITEQDRAILQLKTQRDKMKQFIKGKENCMEKERQMAKELISDGRKDRALLLLKKKRLQEKVVEKTLKQLSQIEQLIQEIEFAYIQQRVVDGLRQGNEILKKMNEVFDVSEIEKIMEETKEAAEYQEEVSNLLSSQLSSSDVESAEVELAALLAAQNAIDEKQKLPEVPTSSFPKSVEEPIQKREKKEKVALEAS